MTVAELLRARLVHADGLYEQGIPVDEIVSLVEATEAQSHYMSAIVWTNQDENKAVDLAAALAALEEKLTP